MADSASIIARARKLAALISGPRVGPKTIHVDRWGATRTCYGCVHSESVEDDGQDYADDIPPRLYSCRLVPTGHIGLSSQTPRWCPCPEPPAEGTAQ